MASIPEFLQRLDALKEKTFGKKYRNAQEGLCKMLRHVTVEQCPIAVKTTEGVPESPDSPSYGIAHHFNNSDYPLNTRLFCLREDLGQWSLTPPNEIILWNNEVNNDTGLNELKKNPIRRFTEVLNIIEPELPQLVAPDQLAEAREHLAVLKQHGEHYVELVDAVIAFRAERLVMLAAKQESYVGP